MRCPAEAVAGIVDRLMRVGPPPAELLVGEQLLVRIVRIASLSQPIAFWQRELLVRAVRVETTAEIGAVVVVPVEFLAALDIGLEIIEIIDGRRSGEPQAAQCRA